MRIARRAFRQSSGTGMLHRSRECEPIQLDASELLDFVAPFPRSHDHLAPLIILQLSSCVYGHLTGSHAMKAER
jgi:hypothetical protein